MRFINLNSNLYNVNKKYQQNILQKYPEKYKILKKYTDIINNDLINIFDSHNKTFNLEYFTRTKDDIFIICIENNKILGAIFAEKFSSFYQPYDKSYYSISYVIVDNNYTHQRIGEKLYYACINEILRKHGTKIFANFIDEKGRNLFCKVAKNLGETPTKTSKMYDLSFSISKEQLYNAIFNNIKNKYNNKNKNNFENNLN